MKLKIHNSPPYLRRFYEISAAMKIYLSVTRSTIEYAFATRHKISINLEKHLNFTLSVDFNEILFNQIIAWVEEENLLAINAKSAFSHYVDYHRAAV